MFKYKRSLSFSLIFIMLISTFLFAPKVTKAAGAERLDVPFFRQVWEPWANETLGFSQDLIVNSGCALTSLAMVFKYYGVDTDPHRLNQWLKDNNGYLGTSSIIWSKATEMTSGKVKYIGMTNYSGTADIDYINSMIDNGYPVIARMDYQNTPHYVVIAGRSGATYYINDPWYENPARTINEAYQPFNYPAAAIKGIVAFTSDYPTPAKVPVRKVQSIFPEGSLTIVQPIKNPLMILQLDNPKIQVGSTLKPIDSKNTVSPILYKDRTMLPIRAVMEEMGGRVSWDEANQKVTIEVQGRTIELWVGMRTYFVNGWELLLDAEPIVVSDRTLLPLRPVLEALGCKIDWDGTTNKITIREMK
jgi:hypothetical protein